MTSTKALATAALLSLMTATPVFAQAAIQEPGAFAFYYPNRDVLNGGFPTAAENLEAQGPAAIRAENLRESGVAAAYGAPTFHSHSVRYRRR